MEITNPYAIRMLLNQPKTTPYSDIFKIVNIKSWTNVKKHKLLFYFKDPCLSHMGPTDIKEIFSTCSNNNDYYNLRVYY